jgi:hypothetical protein
MVRMDNLSAATVTSWFLSGVLTAFIGFIQRRLSLPQGVAEWIIFPWRIPSESGGGMNHIWVALSIIFGWRLASEYPRADKYPVSYKKSGVFYYGFGCSRGFMPIHINIVI